MTPESCIFFLSTKALLHIHNLWVLLLLPALGFFLYRAARFFCKRLILLAQLKKACHKVGATLVAARPSGIFGRRNTKDCDLYIVTEKTAFSVKLFGISGRKSRLIFRHDRTYRILNRWLPDRGPIKLPEYRFRTGYRYEWELKTPRKVLLLNPVCMGVYREESNCKPAPLNPHEQIFGMEIHTMTSLLQTIGEE